MGLDISKLEKVRQNGPNIIARCPACAEDGNDRKGEHLFINDKGKFGCVRHPGIEGSAHRRRIFELIGIKDDSFKVRTALPPATGISVIQKDVLGHLGRFSQTHARKNFELPHEEDNCIDRGSKHVSDPSVPEHEEVCLDDDPRPF